MSRYVDKPHGLTIASGNVFFFKNEYEELQQFRSMLTFDVYDFHMFSMANIDILTPAVQLCWTHKSYPLPNTRNWDDYRKHPEPKPWFTKFLNEECPGWAVRPLRVGNDHTEYALFLQRRGDAVKICKVVEAFLKGIPTKLKG